MAPDGEATTSTNTTPGHDRASLSDPTLVRDWLASHHPKQLALLDKFEIELRLGRLSTSTPHSHTISSKKKDQESDVLVGGDDEVVTSDYRLTVTRRTVELLRTMIGSTRWKTPAQLIVLLRGLGRELHASGGFREPAIGNVVRRVMAAVREEVANAPLQPSSLDADADAGNSGGTKPRKASESAGRSLEGMLWTLPQHVRQSSRGGGFIDTAEEAMSSSEHLPSSIELPLPFYQNRPDVKHSVMEAIQEIMSDLEDLHKNISDQASNHIHAGEIILTYGSSLTVQLFLKQASKKGLAFTVVTENHQMAMALATAGIDTCVIQESAIFAIMARVHKVILPAHAVLANGGLVAPSGSNMVALAASETAVPVVCLTGMFKLTPMYPHEGQDTLNDLLSPSAVVDYAEAQTLGENVELVNPVHDYIRPELINLYVTNVGSFQPSYIYRLLAEHYHHDDWESFE